MSRRIRWQRRVDGEWMRRMRSVTGAPCREVNSKVGTAPNTENRR